MRNPLRTEAEAFSFVLVAVVLFGVVALAGARWGGGVALAVFLALGIGAAAGIYLRSEPRVREPAIWERGGDGARRLLVVANETVTGEALRREILHRVRDDGAAEVLVVAPALATRVSRWTEGEERTRAEAEARLHGAVRALSAAGIAARGRVGDVDPIEAIGDALRAFDADEIVISTHPPGRSRWLERDVVERARERFDCSVLHVVVDLEHEGARTAESAPPR